MREVMSLLSCVCRLLFAYEYVVAGEMAGEGYVPSSDVNLAR